MKNRATQMILGVAVYRAAMPEVYRLAQADAGMLSLVLRGIMRKRSFTDPLLAMKLLEGDLGYKSASPVYSVLPRRR